MEPVYSRNARSADLKKANQPQPKGYRPRSASAEPDPNKPIKITGHAVPQFSAGPTRVKNLQSAGDSTAIASVPPHPYIYAWKKNRSPKKDTKGGKPTTSTNQPTSTSLYPKVRQSPTQVKKIIPEAKVLPNSSKKLPLSKPQSASTIRQHQSPALASKQLQGQRTSSPEILSISTAPFVTRNTPSPIHSQLQDGPSSSSPRVFYSTVASPPAHARPPDEYSPSPQTQNTQFQLAVQANIHDAQSPVFRKETSMSTQLPVEGLQPQSSGSRTFASLFANRKLSSSTQSPDQNSMPLSIGIKDSSGTIEAMPYKSRSRERTLNHVERHNYETFAARGPESQFWQNERQGDKLTYIGGDDERLISSHSMEATGSLPSNAIMYIETPGASDSLVQASPRIHKSRTTMHELLPTRKPSRTQQLVPDSVLHLSSYSEINKSQENQTPITSIQHSSTPRKESFATKLQNAFTKTSSGSSIFPWQRSSPPSLELQQQEVDVKQINQEYSPVSPRSEEQPELVLRNSEHPKIIGLTPPNQEIKQRDQQPINKEYEALQSGNREPTRVNDNVQPRAHPITFEDVVNKQQLTPPNQEIKQRDQQPINKEYEALQSGNREPTRVNDNVQPRAHPITFEDVVNKQPTFADIIAQQSFKKERQYSQSDAPSSTIQITHPQQTITSGPILSDNKSIGASLTEVEVAKTLPFPNSERAFAKPAMISLPSPRRKLSEAQQVGAERQSYAFPWQHKQPVTSSDTTHVTSPTITTSSAVSNAQTHKEEIAVGIPTLATVPISVTESEPPSPRTRHHRKSPKKHSLQSTRRTHSPTMFQRSSSPVTSRSHSPRRSLRSQSPKLERAFAKPAMISLPSPRRKSTESADVAPTQPYSFAWQQRPASPAGKASASEMPVAPGAAEIQQEAQSFQSQTVHSRPSSPKRTQRPSSPKRAFAKPAMVSLPSPRKKSYEGSAQTLSFPSQTVSSRPSSPKRAQRPSSPKRAFAKPAMISLPSPRKKSSDGIVAGPPQPYSFAWQQRPDYSVSNASATQMSTAIGAASIQQEALTLPSQAPSPTRHTTKPNPMKVPPASPKQILKATQPLVRSPSYQVEKIPVEEERAFTKPSMTSLPSPRTKAQSVDQKFVNAEPKPYLYPWQQHHDPEYVAQVSQQLEKVRSMRPQESTIVATSALHSGGTQQGVPTSPKTIRAFAKPAMTSLPSPRTKVQSVATPQIYSHPWQQRPSTTSLHQAEIQQDISTLQYEGPEPGIASSSMSGYSTSKQLPTEPPVSSTQSPKPVSSSILTRTQTPERAFTESPEPVYTISQSPQPLLGYQSAEPATSRHLSPAVTFSKPSSFTSQSSESDYPKPQTSQQTLVIHQAGKTSPTRARIPTSALSTASIASDVKPKPYDYPWKQNRKAPPSTKQASQAKEMHHIESRAFAIPAMTSQPPARLPSPARQIVSQETTAMEPLATRPSMTSMPPARLQSHVVRTESQEATAMEPVATRPTMTSQPTSRVPYSASQIVSQDTTTMRPVSTRPAMTSQSPARLPSPASQIVSHESTPAIDPVATRPAMTGEPSAHLPSSVRRIVSQETTPSMEPVAMRPAMTSQPFALSPSPPAMESVATRPVISQPSARLQSPVGRIVSQETTAMRQPVATSQSSRQSVDKPVLATPRKDDRFLVVSKKPSPRSISSGTSLPYSMATGRKLQTRSKTSLASKSSSTSKQKTKRKSSLPRTPKDTPLHKVYTKVTKLKATVLGGKRFSSKGTDPMIPVQKEISQSDKAVSQASLQGGDTLFGSETDAPWHLRSKETGTERDSTSYTVGQAEGATFGDIISKRAIEPAGPTFEEALSMHAKEPAGPTFEEAFSKRRVESTQHDVKSAAVGPDSGVRITPPKSELPSQAVSKGAVESKKHVVKPAEVGPDSDVRSIPHKSELLPQAFSKGAVESKKHVVKPTEVGPDSEARAIPHKSELPPQAFSKGAVESKKHVVKPTEVGPDSEVRAIPPKSELPPQAFSKGAVESTQHDVKPTEVGPDSEVRAKPPKSELPSQAIAHTQTDRLTRTDRAAHEHIPIKPAVAFADTVVKTTQERTRAKRAITFADLINGTSTDLAMTREITPIAQSEMTEVALPDSASQAESAGPQPLETIPAPAPTKRKEEIMPGSGIAAKTEITAKPEAKPSTQKDVSQPKVITVKDTKAPEVKPPVTEKIPETPQFVPSVKTAVKDTKTPEPKQPEITTATPIAKPLAQRDVSPLKLTALKDTKESEIKQPVPQKKQETPQLVTSVKKALPTIQEAAEVGIAPKKESVSVEMTRASSAAQKIPVPSLPATHHTAVEIADIKEKMPMVAIIQKEPDGSDQHKGVQVTEKENVHKPPVTAKAEMTHKVRVPPKTTGPTVKRLRSKTPVKRELQISETPLKKEETIETFIKGTDHKLIMQVQPNGMVIQRYVAVKDGERETNQQQKAGRPKVTAGQRSAEPKTDRAKQKTVKPVTSDTKTVSAERKTIKNRPKSPVTRPKSEEKVGKAVTAQPRSSSASGAALHKQSKAGVKPRAKKAQARRIDATTEISPSLTLQTEEALLQPGHAEDGILEEAGGEGSSDGSESKGWWSWATSQLPALPRSSLLSDQLTEDTKSAASTKSKEAQKSTQISKSKETPGPNEKSKHPRHIDLAPMYRFLCETILGIPPRDKHLTPLQDSAGPSTSSTPTEGGTQTLATAASQKSTTNLLKEQSLVKQSKTDAGVLRSLGAYGSATIFRVLFGGPAGASVDVTPSPALARITRTLFGEHPVSPHTVEPTVHPAKPTVTGAIHELPFPGVGPAQPLTPDGFPDSGSRESSSTTLLKQNASRYNISTPVFGRFGSIVAFPAFYSNTSLNPLNEANSRHTLATEFDPNVTAGPSTSSTTDPASPFYNSPRSPSFMRGFQASDRSGNAVSASRRRNSAEHGDCLSINAPTVSRSTKRNYSEYSVLSVRRSFQIRRERKDAAESSKKK